MLARPRRRRHRLAAVVAIALSQAGLHNANAHAPQLIIAPHIDGLAFCQKAVDLGVTDEFAAIKLCTEANQNAASRIVAALNRIGPVTSPSGEYVLGYTLPLPLLSFYDRWDGGWQLDLHRIALAVRTIAEVDRPVAIYASANHFGNDVDPTLLQELAADPSNLMNTSTGPLTPDRYFAVQVYAWSLSHPNSRVEQMRRAALAAIIDDVCRLNRTARKRIVAFSVLGETHDMWPNFFSGMGYTRDPDFTDYSAASTAQFHQWLEKRFDGHIGRLNTLVDGEYASFDAVAPPSEKMQLVKPGNYLEGNDAYANGIVPIFGWAHQRDGLPVHISVYLNGSPVASVLADMNRMDVFQAKPSVGTPNVGWRYDFDYSALPPAIYTLEIFAASTNTAPMLVAERRLVVVDRMQGQPATLPVKAGFTTQGSAASVGLDAFVDSPADMTPLFYNPLARLWDAFRNDQVRYFIEGYADQVSHSCLPQGTVFEYQMTPRLYTSWNPDLMAVDASLQPDSHYSLGVSLYGGAAFGQKFFQWLKQTPRATYGVTEMHPMIALPVKDLEAMLNEHRLAGARFLAPYYISILPAPMLRFGGLSNYRIDPENPQYGSAEFYSALRDVMRN